jgi:uncharacterized DUF497 family protein
MYNVSTMEEGGFEWDSHNIAHIKRHRVSPFEAEQVITSEPLYPDFTPQTIKGELRWTVYGQTNQNRCLVVVFTERGTLLRVVTAYEMSAPERNSYLLWRAQQNEAQDDEYPQEYGVTEENDDDAQ